MSDLLQKALDDGSCCGECPHYYEWQERHPYGAAPRRRRRSLRVRPKTRMTVLGLNCRGKIKVSSSVSISIKVPRPSGRGSYPPALGGGRRGTGSATGG